MIDLKFFRNHLQEIRENCEKRNVKVDLDSLQKIYDIKHSLDQKIQEIQTKRNQIAKKMKKKLEKDERDSLIQEAKKLKIEEGEKKQEFQKIEAKFQENFSKIPNLTHPEVPLGHKEEENKEIKQWGTIPAFDFTPKDHVELGEFRNWIDFKNASKVTGSKFYYLKGDLVLLELSLIRYALDLLIEEGFEICTTPDLARTSMLEGLGFNPRGEESQVYSIENKSKEDGDLCLIGTAEITLGGLYSDTIFEKKELPLLIGGLSHCFRTEAGSHGKASKGLYRVHQFNKVEMFAFTLPEESEKMHQKFLALEEKIYQNLEIPYRVVDVCAGDLGGPAYRKYDIEAWMPGRGKKGEWGEVTSTSNCTDYQARRLKIRFKRTPESSTEFVHMLNGTAIALSRTLIALLENFQDKDGFVRIPKVLQPLLGKEII